MCCSTCRRPRRRDSERYLVVCLALLLLVAVQSVVAYADERRAAVVGEIWFTDQSRIVPYQNAFRAGLREHGYIEGRNLTIVVRYAHGDSTRLSALTAELLAMDVDVMLVSVSALGVVKRITTTVPIVCAGFGDPVREGYVSSLARPGGNITGLSWQSPDASSKRLQLTLEALPRLRQLAQLFDASDQTAIVEASAGRKAAEAAGVRVRSFPVRNLTEIEAAFAAMERSLPQALLVTHTPFTLQHRDTIIRLASAHRIPVISEARDFAEAGALLTYGPYPYDLFKRAATYVDKILRGAKPGDLPIEQAAHFELILNLRSAKMLGLTIPESVVLRANEVIQ